MWWCSDYAEYVVYNSSQVALRYIVRMCKPDDGSGSGGGGDSRKRKILSSGPKAARKRMRV